MYDRVTLNRSNLFVFFITHRCISLTPVPKMSSFDEEGEGELTVEKNNKMILVKFNDGTFGVTTMGSFHKPKFPVDGSLSYSDCCGLLEGWIKKKQLCAIR